MARLVDKFGNQPLPKPPPGRGRGQFNPYAAGKKHYGGGRSFPNMGPVKDKLGYKERDNKARARKSAILRRMRGQASGNAMNPEFLKMGR